MQGCEHAEETSSQAASAGESLQKITDAVTGISGMNQQIATAAHQQGTVVAELDRNISHIKSGADESGQSAQKTAASGAQLAELAVELRALVGQFNLSEPGESLKPPACLRSPPFFICQAPIAGVASAR